MSKKQIIKLLCLNLGIALLNVILFSAGFVGCTHYRSRCNCYSDEYSNIFLWELYNTI